MAYRTRFEGAKLVWPHFQSSTSFCLDESLALLNNKCFFVAGADPALCALLNSSTMWFQLLSEARIKRGGYIEAEAQYVTQLRIPEIAPDTRARLAARGLACTGAAGERFDIQSAVRRRVLDFAPPERPRLTGPLHKWHELDFAAFRAEIKHAYRADIPVRERGEWERYLRDNAARVLELSDRIAAAEREIDQIVYAQFDLTPDEIALLEVSLEGQY